MAERVHAEFTVSKAAWEHQRERAKQAEAALADLRAGIEALADEWSERAAQGAREPRHKRPEWIPALRSRAEELRALLGEA